jgi:WD40 repeat protein
MQGSGDNSLAVVKINGNESDLLLERKYHGGDVNCVKCWAGEKTWLASVGDDEKLVIWKVNL